MHRTALILVLGFLVASPIAVAWAQGDSESSTTRSEQQEPTRFKLSVPETDLATYEAELRYRMIWKMVGFVLLLGFLHLVQVKLKINRAYFWFMVCGVIFLFVLNGYRPKYDPNQKRLQSNDPPTYAPTHAR